VGAGAVVEDAEAGGMGVSAELFELLVGGLIGVGSVAPEGDGAGLEEGGGGGEVERARLTVGRFECDEAVEGGE